MTKETTTISKQKDHAFNKDVFLLGKDARGTKYWLESPSWDCGWYWGFGYIETYQGNREPSNARDIDSHSHATNFLSEYFTSWNGSEPVLTKRTFTEQEGWELCELFQQFYHLKEQAEFYGRGKMNCGNTTIRSWEDKPLAEKINREMIPVVTARIMEILTPLNS